MPQVVVIDPGHGGNAAVGGSSPNNATGPTGLLEKNVTLEVCQRVASHVALLAYDVRLTRNADVNVGIVQRAHLARDNNAAVFVSVHFNGNSDPAIQGSEAWVGRNSPETCTLLARGILDRVVAANGLRDRGVKSTTGTEYGVVNPANHLATTAYTLLELSFLTNPAEEARLKTVPYLDLLAGAIAIGIDDYLKMSSGSVEPLHFAIRSGSAGAVRELLKAGPDLDATDLHGMTPLMIASKAGNARMIKMLVNAGAQAMAPAKRKKAAPGKTSRKKNSGRT